MKKYIAIFVGVFLLGAISYSVYNEIQKKKVSGKLQRLSCHKNITCFEKGYSDEGIEKAKELLKKGNYRIVSSIDKSTYTPSTLFQYVNDEDMDKFLYNHISILTQTKPHFQEGITVQYTIYENDKDDPKKKSDNCKLFRGYVVFKILDNHNKLVYQIQIDFLDYEGADIPKTLECALESFLTFE